MTDPNTLSIAKEYVQHGFSIIPLYSKSKKPNLSWGEFQERMPTNQELETWFGSGSQKNIGIVTGAVSGLVVLDADSIEAVEWCKANLPVTPTAKTARGQHYYFKCESGFKNSVKLKGLDLDMRAEGGYVVAPPSEHETGVTYAWFKDRSLDDLDLADFPSELLSNHNKTKPSTSSTSGKYGKAALASELTKLTGAVEGTRNDQLNRSAFSLGQLVAGGELKQHQVEATLLETGVSMGLPEAEARTTIKSGIEAGAKEPRRAPESSARVESVENITMPPEEWPELVNLSLPNLPSFDEDDFPSDMWAMISCVAKNLEVPAELPGMLGLSVVATAVQKKLEIEIENGYTEPLNIWTLTALEPGTRKSAALREMYLPLLEWEDNEAKRLAPYIKKATMEREIEEGRLKALRAKFAKEDKPTNRQTISKDIHDQSETLTEIPITPRLIAQDVTPEHLGTMLGNQGERIAIFSAEGGIFETIAGRYASGTPNLDIFLQGHAGDMVRVDRGSRPSVILQEPAITMGICPQPDVLRTMAAKPGFRGRGLIARFLYALPPSPLGHRKLQAAPISPEIKTRYVESIQRLLNMKPELNNLTDEIPKITLTTGALQAWKNFQRWVEDELGDGGKFEYMKDWAAKLPGAAARVAGLFHCIEYAFDAPNGHQVTLDTMHRALSLMKKLSSHAIAVYDLMGLDPEIEAARKILKWIKRKKNRNFTVRDCHHALQGSFKKRNELKPGFMILVERCYISNVISPNNTQGGRPSEVYDVNPHVFGE